MRDRRWLPRRNARGRSPALLVALALALALAASATARARQAGTFELRDGDRVVLLGDTFVERDQDFGYLETLLTTRYPGKSITFRNLGWSGDNIRGMSRSGFGPEAEGNQRQREGLLALKPTVVVLGYGMADSFDGKAGLPPFVAGLNALIDLAEKAGARVVLLTPIAHEDLGRPFPDPKAHNQDLLAYSQAIGDVARARKAAFVDLFAFTDTIFRGRTQPRPLIRPSLTDDGIHLNALGSYAVAITIADGLGARVGDLDGGKIAIKDGRLAEAKGTTASGLETTSAGLRFTLVDEILPPPPVPAGEKNAPVRRIAVAGLKPGRHQLKIDGKAVASGTDREWAESIAVAAGPEFDQAEALRLVINEKNRLYFHRWRPQNETYLFGFRKHEQGNNAREIPLFDPLVEAKEQEIARLKTPVQHVYEIVRESGEGK